ncbi:MAG: hypothetical protein ACRCTJ_01130 [Brevinema sp.]
MKPVFYNKFGVMWHHYSGEKVHEVLSYPVAVTLGAVIKHCKQRRDVKKFYVNPIKSSKKELLSV